MRQHTTGRGWVRFARNQIEEGEQSLLEAVIAARRMRVTWEQIGEALGITAQAAHSRFARKVAEAEGTDEDPEPTITRW